MQIHTDHEEIIIERQMHGTTISTRNCIEQSMWMHNYSTETRNCIEQSMQMHNYSTEIRMKQRNTYNYHSLSTLLLHDLYLLVFWRDIHNDLHACVVPF
jgi:hypothetical protein